MNFLITGLPRSKTAWMSVVASTVSGAICYHEPMSHMKSWECCFELWKKSPYRHTGVSDSHLGFHLKRIVQQASPRVLVILRDEREVEASLESLGFPKSNYCSLLRQGIDAFLAEPNADVAVARFEGLQDPNMVVRCLEHLMPGCHPQMTRIREFMSMNVQADMDLVWKRAIESSAHIDKILGADLMPEIQIYQ